MTEQGSRPEQGTEEVAGAGRQAGSAAPGAAAPERDGVQDSVQEDSAQSPTPGDDAASGEGAAADDGGDAATGGDATGGEHADSVLAAERLVDLQRLQAEYVNYKRRVDRDRAVVQERAARSVVEALLPVLDDIHAAREHGDLEGGPFASIADKLESTLGKFGLERYGAIGEEFDPNLHEALMHTAWPQDGSVTSTGSTTVVQVLQPGYRAGEQVLRAARVAVADPE